MIGPRPRRSVLSMPGANARALAKGRALPADVVMMDLEDAVAPEAKPAARDAVMRAIADGGYGGREIVVRINGSDTRWWADDVAAVARSGADAMLLPKVESPEVVVEAAAALAAAGAAPSLALWCMVETPRGVLGAGPIAAAHPLLAALVAGTADLAKALRARPTPDRLPLVVSLGLILLAARAYGLAAIDAPFFDLADDSGLVAACRQGADLGFDGKMVLHPRQIAAANAAFGPSAEDVARARRVVEAHRLAVAEGKGVTLLDGKLVEALHVEEASRLMALAERIAAL